MNSANLPFTVHYRRAAKSEQGMQHKFSAPRSLAASLRALITHAHMHACTYLYMYRYVCICISMLERERGREREFGAGRGRGTSCFQKAHALQKLHKKNLLGFVAPLLDFSCIGEIKKPPNILIFDRC